MALALRPLPGTKTGWELTDPEALPGVAVLLDLIPGDDFRLRATTMTIKAPNGATPTLLRQIPLGTALDALNREWRAHLDQSSFAALTRRPSPLPPVELAVPTTRQYPDSFYVQVAAVWLAVLAAGIRAPGDYVAKANGVPTSTVNSWVRRARARGLLPPTVKGRPGRSPAIEAEEAR